MRDFVNIRDDARKTFNLMYFLMKREVKFRGHQHERII